MNLVKVVAAVAFLIPTASQAIVIDFNTAVGTPDGYSEAGVDFSYLGTGDNFFGTSVNGTRAIALTGDFAGKMRADITGGASSVSVDLGDNNHDPDRLILQVYNASDVLLTSIIQDIDNSYVGMLTLSLSADGIAYAIFGTTGELGIGGIYADNFTFEPAVVDEPSVIALMGIGLAGIGFAKKKKA